MQINQPHICAQRFFLRPEQGQDGNGHQGGKEQEKGRFYPEHGQYFTPEHPVKKRRAGFPARLELLADDFVCGLGHVTIRPQNDQLNPVVTFGANFIDILDGFGSKTGKFEAAGC